MTEDLNDLNDLNSSRELFYPRRKNRVHSTIPKEKKNNAGSLPVP